MGIYAKSSFLSMFQLQFIKVNAASAFSQLHSIVISKKMAEKVFKSKKGIGKKRRGGKTKEKGGRGERNESEEKGERKGDWSGPVTSCAEHYL